MAIFVNHQKKQFVITSYKVAYSTLFSQQNKGLKYLDYRIRFAILKHMVKHSNYNRYLIVRNPYDRFLSLFADKFRKQPTRILDNLHTWENVHTCLFPYLDISPQDTDEAIATKFFEMTISDFLSLLPKVIQQDEHFMPQGASRQFNLLGQIPINVRLDACYRLEDQQEELSQLTGLDFGIRQNNSNSRKFKDALTREDLTVLNDNYKHDFELGTYSIKT